MRSLAVVTATQSSRDRKFVRGSTEEMQEPGKGLNAAFKKESTNVRMVIMKFHQYTSFWKHTPAMPPWNATLFRQCPSPQTASFKTEALLGGTSPPSSHPPRCRHRRLDHIAPLTRPRGLPQHLVSLSDFDTLDSTRSPLRTVPRATVHIWPGLVADAAKLPT